MDGAITVVRVGVGVGVGLELGLGLRLVHGAAWEPALPPCPMMRGTKCASSTLA